jgi:hypothetical protein
VLLTSTGWHICNSFSVWTPIGWVKLSSPVLSSPVESGWVIWSCSHSHPEVSAVMRRQQHLKAELGSFVGNQVASNFASYHEWNVLLNAVNVQHGIPDFTSLLKEVVLWIFIALKNPSTLARIEPTNLGPKSKHITTRPARQEKVINW